MKFIKIIVLYVESVHNSGTIFTCVSMGKVYSLLFEHHWARHISFLSECRVISSTLSWRQGVELGNNNENYFHMCLYGKNLTIWLGWAMWPLGLLFYGNTFRVCISILLYQYFAIGSIHLYSYDIGYITIFTMQFDLFWKTITLAATFDALW
jgi:hypothetical protein